MDRSFDWEALHDVEIKGFYDHGIWISDTGTMHLLEDRAAIRLIGGRIVTAVG